MFMIEGVDEIRNFYQLTLATQSPGAAKLPPLHFLPTCIGCSKRWACTDSRQRTAWGNC